jgi:hypothetical protein
MKTTEDKIKKLKKITYLLLKFSKHFNDVLVFEDKGIVTVKWYSPKPTKRGSYHAFDMKEIPIEDLDAAIERYKNRLKYEWNHRNDV